ncbi:hypothetical protein GCM10018783_26030 [Streptomyces griseosporeus]|nr:hypothetical protein GCM10018783_26030 [Streptomyces griseosporeus]
MITAQVAQAPSTTTPAASETFRLSPSASGPAPDTLAVDPTRTPETGRPRPVRIPAARSARARDQDWAHRNG